MDILNEVIGTNTIIAYHGTDSQPFDEFNYDDRSFPKAIGALKGFYFSADKDDAMEYGDNLLMAKLHYNKMFTGSPKAYFEKKYNMSLSFGASKDDYKRYKHVINNDNIMKYLTDNNYDIVHVPKGEKYINVDEYIVFDPTNIEILKWYE